MNQMNEEKGQYGINGVMAMTNILGFILFLYNLGYCNALLGLMSCASFLMHLSETKHDLSGMKHSNFYLNCDRVLTYICGLTVLWHMYNYWQHVSWQLIAYGLSGILFAAISELDNYYIPLKESMFRYPVYVATHTAWHIVAYTTYQYVVFIIPQSAQL